MATPVRQITSRETATSLGVLLLLAGVATWFGFRQACFSPAVTVAATAARAAERAGAPKPATGTLAAASLLTPLPAGLRAMSPEEAFNRDTLSDKIDGKAELYLPAGFKTMRCQRLATATNPGAWFEAFIYDMDRPENAFAVYSSQKRSATEDAGIGDHGYRAGNQLCLVHGPYYVEIVGADAGEATRAAAAELARAFISATPVAAHANVARDEALFPADGLIPGSMMLLSADVFGFDQLNQTWIAKYREGRDTVTLFITRRPAPADAIKLASAVRGFFITDCGGVETPPPAAPAGAVIVDLGGSCDAVFMSGSFVAGVHQAPNRASTERWLAALSDRLKSVTP